MNSLTVALNIFRRISKEKAAFFGQVLAPVLIGLVMFSALTSGPAQKKEAVGVVNSDAGAYGSILVDHLKAQEGYRILVLTKDEMEKRVEQKKAKTGILIPGEFSMNIEAGMKPEVMLYRTDESIISENLKFVVDTFVSNAASIVKEGKGAPEDVEAVLSKMDDSLVYVSKEIPESRQDNLRNSTVFGFFMMFILQFAVLGVGLILEDKRGKTFMRTYCAPIKNHEVVLGNLLANFIMGMAMIGLFLLLARLIYGINAGPGIFLLLTVCLITAIGYAIGIAGLIRDGQKFTAVSGPIAGFMCILGGCFMPLEMLPVPMQKLSGAFPTRWAMDGIKTMLNGGSIKDIYMELAILLLFGTGLFIFGIKTLKPNVEDL